MDRKEMRQDIASQAWNVQDQYKGLSLDDLRAISDQARLPYAVCAINITGDLNIGMMLRSACLMGAERFIIYGRKKFDKRTTVGAQNYIDVVSIDAKESTHSIELNYDNFFTTMSEYGYAPVFFDTGGTPLDEFCFVDTWLDTKPCLVFGNEGMGLPVELTKGREIVSIPQRGVMRSLNVSSAASIVMYEAMKAFTAPYPYSKVTYYYSK